MTIVCYFVVIIVVIKNSDTNRCVCIRHIMSAPVSLISKLSFLPNTLIKSKSHFLLIIALYHLLNDEYSDQNASSLPH